MLRYVLYCIQLVEKVENSQGLCLKSETIQLYALVCVSYCQSQDFKLMHNLMLPRPNITSPSILLINQYRHSSAIFIVYGAKYYVGHTLVSHLTSRRLSVVDYGMNIYDVLNFFFRVSTF